MVVMLTSKLLSLPGLKTRKSGMICCGVTLKLDEDEIISPSVEVGQDCTNRLMSLLIETLTHCRNFQPHKCGTKRLHM